MLNLEDVGLLRPKFSAQLSPNGPHLFLIVAFHSINPNFIFRSASQSQHFELSTAYWLFKILMYTIFLFECRVCLYGTRTSLTESPKLLFSLNDSIILDQNGSVSPNDAMFFFFVCLFVFVLFWFFYVFFFFFKFSFTRCLGLLKLYRFHIWVSGCFNQNYEFTSSEWQFFK